MYPLNYHNDDNPEHVDNKEKIDTLKSIREKINWAIKEDRYHFLDILYPVLMEYARKGRFPDLRDIFPPEEIECLLADSINY
uniref:Uncharacterized protein n=1 Tax=Trichogramma kaykai TaxID=54128 RepID=A0ABD2VUJ9_9HYME